MDDRWDLVLVVVSLLVVVSSFLPWLEDGVLPSLLVFHGMGVGFSLLCDETMAKLQ